MTVRKIKSIGDIPYPIDVGADALSPLLTAGAALGITGNDAEESAWLARTSEADGVASVRSIHGRTLRWNQLLQNGDFADNSGWATSTATLSVSDNKATVTNTTTSYVTLKRIASMSAIANHKYLIAFTASSTAGKVMIIPADATANGWTQITGITSETRVGWIWQPTSNVSFTAALRFPVTTSGTEESVTATIRDYCIFDLTTMFGAGNEPSTVAEFEALFPLPYYEYDAGSLLPVNMTGIESTGFNQWDEEVEAGGINTGTGQNTTTAGYNRSKNYIPVFPSTEYYIKAPTNMALLFYDADRAFIANSATYRMNTTFTTPANARYMRFRNDAANAWPTYNHDICINISDPTRNGEYEPYWQQQRSIPAGILRSAGTVYDEQTATERIERVRVVDLGTLTWTKGNALSDGTGTVFYAGLTTKAHDNVPDCECAELNPVKFTSPYENATKGDVFVTGSAVVVGGDSSLSASDFKASMNGVVLYAQWATPTTTPIDPPLNMTYRTAAGGTERVMVPTGEQSAPPTLVTAQGYTAESLRDAALSAIAPVENGLASTNYGIGSYLVHGGQLCRVTVAIATGEAITIGTNVTATTVMAEVLSLTQ